MTQARPILYSLIAPFNPKWVFAQFAADSKKASISITSFSFGILAILAVYSLQLSVRGYTPQYSVIHTLGFVLGLILRNLILAYLLPLFIGRLGFGKITWPMALGIVSFAMLPLMIGSLWTLIDRSSAYTGQMIGTCWNAIIIIVGLKAIRDVPTWKAAFLVLGVFLTFSLLKAALFGRVM